MCGLVGYVGPAPLVDAVRLAHMRDTLRHRGPDDAGLHVERGAGYAVGLGHRRLAVLDPRPAGRQPMSGPGGLQLVFNGEIYNFKALRAELAAAGHTFSTGTDTEVLLALYRAHGVDMLPLLNGMFAFALWDAPRRRLLLARDRFGIKPLYVADLGPRVGLLFASEPRALMASGRVDDAIDLQAHHDYLALNYVPGGRSILRGVRKLKPAHALCWQDGALDELRYWKQTFHSEAPTRPPDFVAAAAQTRERVLDAVRRRLVSDVPVGMFLSGGLDSTAVLMAMSELGSAPVKAFTIRFDEPGFDESPHARRAAAHFRADHHLETVRPEPDTFLGPLIETMDEPFADSSAIPLWYLARLARRHVTVALGGDGGDEVFAGYQTHLAWQLSQAWRWLPARVRERWAPHLVARLPVSHGKVPLSLKARAFVAAASLEAPQAHYRYKEFLSEDARRALWATPTDVRPTVRLFEAAFARRPAARGLDAVLHSDFEVYLPDDILVKVDRMSMSHGLEARVPFLDHELVQHAAALPARYKLRGLTTKAVLRRALLGHAPAELLRRRKSGFNVPMAAWLAGPLRTLARDMLAPARVQRLGLWAPEVVTRMLVEHEARQRDHSRSLWALLCFSLFNDRFRAGRPA